LKLDLKAIRTAANVATTPNKIVIVGEAGAGKTTLAAHMPNPLFISAKGEGSGLTKLAEAKTIPSTVAYLPEISLTNTEQHDGWSVLVETLRGLLTEKHEYKTIIFDCFDDEGFLGFAYQHHADDKYKGDMGPAGFMNYQNGYSTALSEVRRVTHGACNALIAKGMDVVMLMHATTSPYRNPDGDDYQRHCPLVNQKYVWPLIRGWADMVLYATYQTTVVEGPQEGKGKAVGGRTRVLHTSHAATHDAKNRHGLPETILLPDDPALSYATLAKAMNTKGSK
jgi:hypothetical protein